MLNRGFDLLPKLERDIDMVPVESILTTSVGGERKPIRALQESYYERVSELRAAQARQTSLKLYSLDWDPTDLAGIRDIYAIQHAHVSCRTSALQHSPKSLPSP